MDSELLNLFHSNIQGDSDLLKSFCLAIQDGHLKNLETTSIQDGGHGGNLETLQTTSDSELLKAI